MSAVATPTDTVITTNAAVRALSVEDSGRSLPVRLQGVVILKTWSPDALILMDAQEGLYIVTPGTMSAAIKSGDWLEVIGTTAPGDFAPIAVASSLRVLGQKPLPEPLRTTMAEVAAGGFDARWIELEGIVRKYDRAPFLTGTNDPRQEKTGSAKSGSPTLPPYGTVFTLAWGDERMRFPVDGDIDAEKLVDARIRIRGVCFNVHNSNRQFVRASIQSKGREWVSVIKEAPPDPFALPLQRAADLLKFSPTGFDGHRVHVRGVVTSHLAGDTLWIRDGERGLKVQSSQVGQIVPGDLVDVAGFAANNTYAPSLEDAVFKRLEQGPPPLPIAISLPEEALTHEADLVQIEADLEDLRDTPEGLFFRLNWNGADIEAMLPMLGERLLDREEWEIGSHLRLAGICSLAPAGKAPEAGLWKAENFQLLLRGPADVTILRAAPWLNPRRTLWLVGAAAALLLVGIVWISIASRRQIRLRVDERKMAEVEFAAMLKERNRVARDIHDTLAQGLNAVSMQLELAKTAIPQDPDGIRDHVGTAHTIVRSCISEARESIWNMRSHILEQTDLAGALDQVLRQLSSALNLGTKVTVTGTPRRLAPMVENSLLRIGQECISNAVKHARAKNIDVTLAYERSRIRLSVRDDGIGFAGPAAGAATSRFGLAGMRERVALITGELHIASEPGQGTEVVVTVTQPA